MAYFTNIHGKYIKDPKLWEQIAYVKNKIGFSDIVGLEADFENGIFKRIANAEGKTAGQDFDTFPMYGGRRLCNLADDGTVNAWYGEQGYTEDGSNGQVMVWQPRFYYKMIPLKLQEIVHQLGETTTAIANNNTTNPITIDGEEVTAVTDDVATYNSSNFRWDGSKWTTVGADITGYCILKARYYISAVRKNGFKLHPAFYNEAGKPVQGIFLSAYEGSIYDVSGNEYLKYDSWDVTENGSTYTINSFNGKTADFANDKLCSIAEVKPTSGDKQSLTRTNSEKLATNRGAGWHIDTIKTLSMEQLLFIVEFGMFNSQNALGNGASNWISGNSHNVSVFTGSTSNLGNATGVASSTSRLFDDGTYETQTTAGYTSVRYRGRENDWGNINTAINGINTYEVGTGKVFVCKDFQFEDEKISGNYESSGISVAQTYGYVKYFGYGKEQFDYLFIPSGKIVNNSAFDDYVWKNVNNYNVLNASGYWGSGKANGLFYSAYHTAKTQYFPYRGARLIYIPQSV